MDLTVFTWPETLNGEINLIKALIERGLKTVHLRKPEWSAQQTAEFLAQLSLLESKTIILHQHPELRHEYPVKGIHFSSRLPLEGREAMLKEDNLVLTTSVHQIDQVKDLPFNLRMAYISPIFDSISKPNHFANFDCYTLQEFLNKYHPMPLIYALGGINTENIPIVKRLGFHGAGVLGTIWEHFRIQGFNSALNHFNNLIQASKV